MALLGSMRHPILLKSWSILARFVPNLSYIGSLWGPKGLQI
jgi:hypothetical protein